MGTVLLHCCKLIERPSKKDGFCFKLFHPLDQSVWAVKVPLGRGAGVGGSGGPGPAGPGERPQGEPCRRWAGRRPVLAPPPQGVRMRAVGPSELLVHSPGGPGLSLTAGAPAVLGGPPGRAHGGAQGQGARYGQDHTWSPVQRPRTGPHVWLPLAGPQPSCWGHAARDRPGSQSQGRARMPGEIWVSERGKWLLV